MRILIHSPSFHPAVGGVETVARLLARSFVRLGHEVRVFTETPSQGFTDDQGIENSSQIIRTSSYQRLYREVRWSESYLQMGLSLKGVYPMAAVRRPWLVSHQTWYTPGKSPLNRLKRGLMKFAVNLYCSEAVARELGGDGHVIGNPYDDEVFLHDPSVSRPANSVVFAGRLVSDKGVDVLLHALHTLQGQGNRLRLTIVGDGPERERLVRLAHDLSLEQDVVFAGAMAPGQLAVTLNQHRFMVVPSRWQEPFGVVALEGIACGCVIVGSQGGGLGEAIGPCGVTFPNGDSTALAAELRSLIQNDAEVSRLMAHRSRHLDRFTPTHVATQYLSFVRKDETARSA